MEKKTEASRTDRGFIKAYAVFLTSNFSRDQEGQLDYTAEYRRVELPFERTVTKDVPAFEKVCGKAAECGFDKLLIFTGDALRYETHPEIAKDGAWTVGELKEQLAKIRSLGMEPIPMLDFSAAHDIWLGEYSYMVSTEDYYRVCADLIDELCGIFGGPSLFWLGLGEENSEAQMKYDYSVVRGDRLFIHDMKFLFDACRKNGAAPWISCDFYTEYPHLFGEAVGKDVLISSYGARYYYSPESVLSGQKEMKCLEAIGELTKMGYKTVPMLSSWRHSKAPECSVDVLKKWADRENVVGFLRCPFLPVREENLFKLFFEAENTKRILERWNEK